MSAIFMRCQRCGARFIAGVVGSTPWPEHVCPDGTKGAPADFSGPLAEDPAPPAAQEGER